MSTTKAKRTDNCEIESLDVIIVGAGFAGLYLLDRLRSMVVLKARSPRRVGGVTRSWASGATA